MKARQHCSLSVAVYECVQYSVRERFHMKFFSEYCPKWNIYIYIYMRKTVCCTCTDYGTDTEVTKELNISPVLGKMQEGLHNELATTSKQNAL